jgi:hypothetical protein
MAPVYLRLELDLWRDLLVQRPLHFRSGCMLASPSLPDLKGPWQTQGIDLVTLINDQLQNDKGSTSNLAFDVQPRFRDH